MAEIAVVASGNGSNFQRLVEALRDTRHSVSSLICDRKDAYVLERARLLGIPSYIVSYEGKSREEAEREIISTLKEYDISLIVLAGFMRLLSPQFVDTYPDRIINIHPSLLPKYPGTKGIEESYYSGDRELGITIHRVDYGLDTGPILFQKSFKRTGGESLKEIEERIHALEHKYYPEVIIELLDSIETENSKNY